jgi:hypothetical protein
LRERLPKAKWIRSATVVVAMARRQVRGMLGVEHTLADWPCSLELISPNQLIIQQCFFSHNESTSTSASAAAESIGWTFRATSQWTGGHRRVNTQWRDLTLMLASFQTCHWSRWCAISAIADVPCACALQACKVQLYSYSLTGLKPGQALASHLCASLRLWFILGWV